MLEGTLQAIGQRVRVAVQLVDARTGANLWSARFEELTDDFFVMQDKVTQSVINALAGNFGKLATIGREAARRKLPSSLRCLRLLSTRGRTARQIHDRYAGGSHSHVVAGRRT